VKTKTIIGYVFIAIMFPFLAPFYLVGWVAFKSICFATDCIEFAWRDYHEVADKTTKETTK